MTSKRAQIKGILREGTQELEQFQNKVLRPILKTQHDLLLQSFQWYLAQRKIDFSNSTSQAQVKHINSILSKDIAYKNKQVGMIIGHFTLEEYEDYKKHSGEYNRRILQMLKKRLKDTLVGKVD
jgi:hypothetical protein